MLGWFLLFAIAVSWAIVGGCAGLVCAALGAQGWAERTWAASQLLLAVSLFPLAMAAFLGGSRHLLALLGLRSLRPDVGQGGITPSDHVTRRRPLFH